MRLFPILLMGAFFPVPQNAPEVRISTAAWFPPNLTLTAGTTLVELGATVRDSHGHPVAGLKAADFQVLDDKQPREITVFSELHSGRPAVPGNTAPSGPHTIALFFDDAHASPLGVHKSVEAAQKLIAEHLTPGDRVGIFTSSGAVSVDFTSDRDALLAALKRLVWRPAPSAHAAGYPPMTPFEAYVIIHHMDPVVERSLMQEMSAGYCPGGMTPGCGASLISGLQTTAEMVWEEAEPQLVNTLDAIGIVLRHLAAAPPKRVFLMMTPGFPTGTGPMEKRIDAIIDAALRADIRIGAVNPEEVRHISTFGRMLNEPFLIAAANSTGGQYFAETNDTASTLLAAAADPEVSYVLGFQPKGTPNGKYHTLKTLVKGYSVEARTGYLDERGPQETVQQRIDHLAMSDDIAHPFAATLQARPETGGVQVTVAVDAKGLKFPEMEGRHVQELTMLTVLEDAQGNFVAGKQSVLDLAYTPPTLAEKMQKGIQAATSLPATRRGSYRVREVIRELAQDRIWAGTTAVEVK